VHETLRPAGWTAKDAVRMRTASQRCQPCSSLLVTYTPDAGQADCGRGRRRRGTDKTFMQATALPSPPPPPPLLLLLLVVMVLLSLLLMACAQVVTDYVLPV